METLASAKLLIRSYRYFVKDRKCFMTETFIFDSYLIMRTFPARCLPESAPIKHILQTIQTTAWVGRVGPKYMLVYLGYGEEFAEAFWVRKDRLRQDWTVQDYENFSVPVFNYT